MLSHSNVLPGSTQYARCLQCSCTTQYSTCRSIERRRRSGAPGNGSICSEGEPPIRRLHGLHPIGAQLRERPHFRGSPHYHQRLVLFRLWSFARRASASPGALGPPPLPLCPPDRVLFARVLFLLARGLWASALLALAQSACLACSLPSPSRSLPPHPASRSPSRPPLSSQPLSPNAPPLPLSPPPSLSHSPSLSAPTALPPPPTGEPAYHWRALWPCRPGFRV